MTIEEAIKKYSQVEIELLLEYILKKPKEFLYMNPEYKLSGSQVASLSSLVKRRKKGEPIAYILGYKDFYGLRFKVNKQVLVPRPETEVMLERVVDVVQASGLLRRQANGLRYHRSIKILDVGTGSGNIIISLAKTMTPSNSPSGKGENGPVFPRSKEGQKGGYEFYASDVSQKALAVAKTNARNHKVKIKFIHSNILENVRMSFNVIIANLPYGWNEWKNNSSAATVGLKFEPRQALFTGEHGLLIIRKLLEQVAGRKELPKLIYLEFDPRQKIELAQLIRKILPGAEVKFYKDFAKLWRFVEIWLS